MISDALLQQPSYAKPWTTQLMTDPEKDREKNNFPNQPEDQQHKYFQMKGAQPLQLYQKCGASYLCPDWPLHLADKECV